NWAIDLGSTTDTAASTLELSDAELDRVFTPTLVIGDPANTGSITITNAISPANVTTLSLRTGGGITETNNPNTRTITVPNLQISAVNTVSLNQANDVTTGNLMAAVSGNAQAFVFIDKNSLTLGATGAGNAISTNGGPVTVTTLDGNLTVNNDIQAGS